MPGGLLALVREEPSDRLGDVGIAVKGDRLSGEHRRIADKEGDAQAPPARERVAAGLLVGRIPRTHNGDKPRRPRVARAVEKPPPHAHAHPFHRDQGRHQPDETRVQNCRHDAITLKTANIIP